MFNDHAKGLTSSDICADTLYCNVFVTFPDERKSNMLNKLCREWKLALGFGMDEDIQLTRPVVCAPHFADCDVIKALLLVGPVVQKPLVAALELKVATQ